jgi:16S rRNA (uracil1498-N3)-methyltransferase
VELFYAPESAIQGKQVRLGAAEAKHVSRVLRHEVGEHILVADGAGNEYRCVITSLKPKELLAEVISQTRRPREAIVEVCLAAGVLKGNKLDAVVEMATELGVAQIVPLMTSRCVARITPARLRRFQALAIAALKSSTRTLLPRILPAQEFEPFLRSTTLYDLRLLAWEDETRTRLPDVMSIKPRRVALIVGPEGGFSEAEVALARSAGFQTFSMGPRRLRGETACIAALSMVLYHLHEL